MTLVHQVPRSLGLWPAAGEKPAIRQSSHLVSFRSDKQISRSLSLPELVPSFKGKKCCLKMFSLWFAFLASSSYFSWASFSAVSAARTGCPHTAFSLVSASATAFDTRLDSWARSFAPSGPCSCWSFSASKWNPPCLSIWPKSWVCLDFNAFLIISAAAFCAGVRSLGLGPTAPPAKSLSIRRVLFGTSGSVNVGSFNLPMTFLARAEPAPSSEPGKWLGVVFSSASTFAASSSSCKPSVSV
mmetsp:Transcript_56303/g.131949  ORF Transcript_56303/g.131949 Transcript_56303/m.131949 type:complete len:242 (+) Transcript_56303:381-1106(+)